MNTPGKEHCGGHGGGRMGQSAPGHNCPVTAMQQCSHRGTGCWFWLRVGVVPGGGNLCPCLTGDSRVASTSTHPAWTGPRFHGSLGWAAEEQPSP